MNSVPADKPCPHCGRYNNRGLSADAIIVRKGQILLGKRRGEPFKGYWGTFGGFVEWNETVEDTLRRETKEESGLDVTSSKLLGVYSNPARDPRGTITVAYVVEVDGTPKAGDDIEDVKWFDLNALPKLPFDHGQIIADYLSSPYRLS